MRLKISPTFGSPRLNRWMNRPFPFRMRTLALLVVLPLVGCGSAAGVVGQASQLAAMTPAAVSTLPTAIPTMPLPSFVPCGPALAVPAMPPVPMMPAMPAP